MDTLGKLFGSPLRVKLMRLFLFSPKVNFDIEDAGRRTGTRSRLLRTELNFLASIKFLESTSFYKEKEKKKGNKKTIIKKRTVGWKLNSDFIYINSLRDLLVESKLLDYNEIVRRFRGAGNIKLLIVAGVFIKDYGSRADLLIVGDNLKKRVVERILRGIESEIGKELAYAVFETKEFEYRKGMNDKLIRDVLDYPHERLIEKIRAD